jgi:hypothetical protein
MTVSGTYRKDSPPAPLVRCGHDGASRICSPVSAVSPRAAQVMPLAGKKCILHVNAVDSVESVRQQLQRQTGIPPDQQQLFFAGRLLEDGRLLAEYGMPKETNMRLVVRLRGNGEHIRWTGGARQELRDAFQLTSLRLMFQLLVLLSVRSSRHCWCRHHVQRQSASNWIVLQHRRAAVSVSQI